MITIVIIIGEYCIDRTALQRPQDACVPVRIGAFPWPVGEDGADRPMQGAFDAQAWHSWRPFCVPSSTSFFGFETRF